MNTEKLIKDLPKDIIYYIRRLTYKSQKKELLEDIRNYIDTLEIIKELYYKYYIHEEDPIEYMNWLANDIVLYLNEMQGTLYGFTNKYYNICKRNYKLKNNIDVENFIKKLDISGVDKEINIYWALLNINERQQIINSSVRCRRYIFNI